MTFQGRIVASGTLEEIKVTEAYQNVSFTHGAYRRGQKTDLTTHIQEFSTESGLEESADYVWIWLLLIVLTGNLEGQTRGMGSFKKCTCTNPLL